jgi:uncharacterized integral membrane protein (TIGR00697 family)
MISQFIDTIIFVPIAFLGEVSAETLIGLLISTYVIKLIVAAMDTPFIYLIKKIEPIQNFNG